MLVPKLLISPVKKRIFCPKTTKFGPKLAFWAKYRHFWPIWSKAWPKNNADKLSRWFLLCCYQNFYLLPQKLGFLAQKWPNLVQNLHFWSFWAKYCHFLHILSNARPKTNVNKVPRLVFRYVGNKTFDFSSKKKGFLAQKWPNLAQNWFFVQFGPGHAGLFSVLLVGRLVVVARGLYLPTPILWTVLFRKLFSANAFLWYFVKHRATSKFYLCLIQLDHKSCWALSQKRKWE